MKKLILIVLTVTLAMGIAWMPSVAAVEPVPITIHKTIGLDCPEETFRFEAWRDLNNNGVIDAGDTLQGTVDITGAGTGVITVAIFGLYIIHEVLIPGTAYEPQADQIIMVVCEEEVYFHNECECTGRIRILKFDAPGDPLFGATFEICPNPKTGELPCLIVEDNGPNDEDPADGVLLVTGVQVCVPVTVTEVVAPEGYEPAAPTPQEAHVTECGETVVLTFVNEKLRPGICIEKLVDCNDDGEYLHRDTGSYGDTPSWYIRVWNCGNSSLFNVMVSDTNGMSWGPFNLDIGGEWEVTYDGDPIFEDTTNTAEAITEDLSGDVVGPVYDSATNVIEIEPGICIEKLVDCNDDEVYLPRDTGSYGDTPSWYIRVWNCGDSSLFNVMVSDTNGMSWGPFNLDIGEEWEVTYDGDPIYETTTNTAEAIAEDEWGATVGPVTDSATNVVPNGSGYSCSCCWECNHLTVDWEGTITSEPLYCSNDKLAVDCFAPSFDLIHNLFLEKGTHAPVVLTTTHYVIVVRELKETPATPENMEAIVVFNITPANAEFDKDIFLTLGVPEIPADAINVTMAYYDDINGAWELMESEAGGPSGVAELTLSAAINHFSIYGVLAELEPTPPPQPARFTASGLTIVPSVEKTVFVTKTGESVTITANVANNGGQGGTYTVELKLNGEAVDTETVTLSAGQSRQVSFTVPELDYGQYEVEVAGLTDTFTTSRTIAWWLILIIIVAVGLIIWGAVWGTRRKRKTQLEG